MCPGCLDFRRLLDLIFVQPPYDFGPKPECDDQRRYRGSAGSKRDVTEHPEPRNVIQSVEICKYVVEQIAAQASCCSCSLMFLAVKRLPRLNRSRRNVTTSSIFILRDPLTRTMSPGARSSLRYSDKTFFCS